MSDETIHTPNDGRGAREVYVNGRLMHRVTFADTRRGIVRFHKFGARLTRKHDGIVETTRRGKVVVKPVNG